MINYTVGAGAKGLIFTQHADDSLAPRGDDASWPCVLVDFEIARRIALYLDTTTTLPVVKVSRAVTVFGDGVPSPRIAAFSSRGPSATFSCHTKGTKQSSILLLRAYFKENVHVLLNRLKAT